ncbi:helix-turn-helix domain-containing protein [Saccharothrix yanglingensis]|uniref:helix-turn-helix domain-containing protein n=1 Tax=Saccharothrix yanglingensis TaxID=659496 RepID=UPI0027D2CCD9|nr:helix-turn-helix transcriptional regulator [Saccharothrix yanglingensis]
MEPRTSTALSRELGDALRQARRRSAVRTGALVEQLGWSLARISKLEAGTRGTGLLDIARYAGHLRPEQPVFDRIMALAREPDTGYAVRPHRVAESDSVRLLVLHERTAKTIWCYSATVVPVLLQTADYARALMASRADVARGVAVRMERQEVFGTASAPVGVFFLHEAVLHRVVGGPRVMYEQVLRLLFRDHVRLVPLGSVLPASLTADFAHMTFADHRPLTYAELGPASVFMDAPEATEAYRESCAALDRVALGEADTRDALTRWADHYEPGTAETA